tara:strand:+ start:2471 stop:2758 length:288 start_codon:yes stop_codon:yes gene_type:complete
VKYPEFLLNFIAMEFLEPEAEHDVSLEKMQVSAKLLFEMNIENYPKSADAQFYLGVYYLYVDDKELAIQSFEKCLKIDSEHQPATQQLMHLKKGN